MPHDIIIALRLHIIIVYNQKTYIYKFIGYRYVQPVRFLAFVVAIVAYLHLSSLRALTDVSTVMEIANIRAYVPSTVIRFGKKK